MVAGRWRRGEGADEHMNASPPRKADPGARRNRPNSASKSVMQPPHAERENIELDSSATSAQS